MKFFVLLTSFLEMKKKIKRADKQNHQNKPWRRMKNDLKLLKSKSEPAFLRKYHYDDFLQEDYSEASNDKRESANERFSWIDITFEENREIENNEWSSTFLSNSSDVGEDIFLEKDFSSSTLTRRFR